VVLAWSFTLGITGKVVDKKRKVEAANNYLSEPFRLRARVVDMSGVRLDVQNLGVKRVLVRSVEVRGLRIMGRELVRVRRGCFLLVAG